MILNQIVQTGEALEHRGIVVCPLFPRRDPTREAPLVAIQANLIRLWRINSFKPYPHISDDYGISIRHQSAAGDRIGGR